MYQGRGQGLEDGVHAGGAGCGGPVEGGGGGGRVPTEHEYEKMFRCYLSQVQSSVTARVGQRVRDEGVGPGPTNMHVAKANASSDVHAIENTLYTRDREHIPYTPARPMDVCSDVHDNVFALLPAHWLSAGGHPRAVKSSLDGGLYLTLAQQLAVLNKNDINNNDNSNNNCK
jgi:hypothetical protein